MTKPFIPWMGGKSRLADKILPLFPEHTCYVEAFAGAAALFFKKQPSQVEVLNDLNGELVNLYRVIQNHLEEFVRQFKWAITSRQVFAWEQTKRPETLTDIQRAARFFYLQKLAFGGKVDGQNYGTGTTRCEGINLLRIEEHLSMAHLRLNQVNIENLSWSDCIKRYDRPHTLFYCDPPYYGTAGYGIEFGLPEYHLMAELARSIEGKMVISVNDCPEMRDVYHDMTMKSVPITYTVGGMKGRTPKKELIVMNW
jgi:DNA adenine methylase